MSRFKRVLAGSVLAAALVAVPVAPAGAATQAKTAGHAIAACNTCW